MFRSLEKAKGRLHANWKNISLFMVSVLLAFGIWVSRNLSLQYSSLISVPVVGESNLEGRAALSSNTVSVVARCRTTGYHLLRMNRNLSKRNVTVYFSPDDLHHESDDVFFITNNELGGYVSEIFGDNVLLESFISSKVQFKFPEEGHKTVPVQPLTIIGFKPQYAATGRIMVSPDSVIVYGEPNKLQNIDRVETGTIKLESLSRSAHGVIPLDLPRGCTRLSEKEVSYELDVARFVEIRKNVHVGVKNVPAGKELLIYPSQATAVFKCAFPMAGDPTDRVSFYVDYSDFVNSINGRCVFNVSGLSSDIFDYSLEPQVFECIESLDN